MPETDSNPYAAMVREIMFDNDEVLETYFTMLVGGEFWDSGTYRLFLDLDRRAVVYRRTRPGETVRDGETPRLRLLYEVHECRDIAAETLFDTDNDSMSLDNFGYRAWQKEIAAAIENALRTAAGS